MHLIVRKKPTAFKISNAKPSRMERQSRQGHSGEYEQKQTRVVYVDSVKDIILKKKLDNHFTS